MPLLYCSCADIRAPPRSCQVQTSGCQLSVLLVGDPGLQLKGEGRTQAGLDQLDPGRWIFRDSASTGPATWNLGAGPRGDLSPPGLQGTLSTGYRVYLPLTILHCPPGGPMWT